MVSLYRSPQGGSVSRQRRHGVGRKVRLGLFVHSTAESTNDFTISGVTDTNFVGILSFDNDGDFVPNGTLAMELEDCATITIP